MRLVRTSLLFSVVIVVLLTIPTAAAERLADWQRLEMEVSGRVDSDLVTALQRRERVRVIANLEVRAETGEVLRSFTSAADRQALRMTGDLVLGELPEPLFTLTHQYRSIASLAGETDADGVLALLALPSISDIGLDERNAWTLDEATEVAGIKPVRGAGKHGKGVWVGLLDSGVDTDHPDLKKRIKRQECFCGGGCCPNGSDRQSGRGSAEDDVGHGTATGGTIVGMGRVAPTGAAKKASLAAFKIGGPEGPLSSDAIAAMDWILSELPQVRVVNMSFGSGGYRGDCDRKGATNRAFASAINALWDAGIMSAASSGNGARAGKIVRPACIKKAVSVGAVYDANFGLVQWSDCTDPVSGPNLLVCFGDRNKKLDLVAPGALLEVPRLGGGSIQIVGTSFSAPMVAGCVALLRKKYPNATPDEVEAALKSSSVMTADPVNGRQYPALNCEDAFDFLNGA